MHSRATDRRSASKCQGKWPDQTLDQAFGLPEVVVAVSTSRLSCKRAGKTRTLMPVWDSSGESRLRSLRCDSLRRRAMMGRLNHDQGQLFYTFCLDEAVPDDHLVRQIAGVLDLSWVHCELAPYYAKLGRPSIDPVLMIRMLIIGYVFAIPSERALCRDVQVNFADRWVSC